MYHFVPLGLEIEFIVFVWFDFMRNILHDLKSIAFEPCPFNRIIGHEPDLSESQHPEDIGAHPVVTLIGIEAQVGVGLNSITSFFLQLIGSDFIEKANSSAFLVHIKKDTLSFFLYPTHGLMELVAAVATVGSENITGHAGRMYPHQNGFITGPLTFDKSYMFQSV